MTKDPGSDLPLFTLPQVDAVGTTNPLCVHLLLMSRETFVGAGTLTPSLNLSHRTLVRLLVSVRHAWTGSPD